MRDEVSRKHTSCGGVETGHDGFYLLSEIATLCRAVGCRSIAGFAQTDHEDRRFCKCVVGRNSYGGEKILAQWRTTARNGTRGSLLYVEICGLTCFESVCHFRSCRL